MAAFIEKNMLGLYLGEPDFNSGQWLTNLQDLLKLTRVPQRLTNGAEQIGGFIRDRILKDHGS